MISSIGTGSLEALRAIRKISQATEDVSTRETQLPSGSTWPMMWRSWHSVVVHGRDEVMDAARGAYAAFDLEAHLRIDAIAVTGDLAVEHGTCELSMDPKAEAMGNR